MNTQFTSVAFQHLDKPLFNDKKCFENGKRLKTLLITQDQQNKNIQKVIQQRKRTVFTEQMKQMQKQRQQKARKFEVNDDKYIGKLYKKTIRRTQERNYIKKNQLDENINILNIKEIEGFNQDQFFNRRKSQPDTTVSNLNVQDLRRIIKKNQNEVTEIQRYPQSMIQYPHLQQIRKEICKNNQWANFYSPTKQASRGKTNILRFQKRKAQKNSHNKKSRRYQSEDQAYDSVPKIFGSRDSLQFSNKDKFLLKKTISLSQNFKRDSAFSLKRNSYDKFYDYDKKKFNRQLTLNNCPDKRTHFQQNYQKIEQNLRKTSFNNPKMTIGTQHKIQFEKLSPGQKFMQIESYLRKLYSQKMPLSNPSIGYYTNKRVQGLYQCQLMRNSQKIFGRSKYLEKMGKLMEQVKNKGQTMPIQESKVSKKCIESIKKNSSLLTFSRHSYSKSMLSSVNKNNTTGQISQAELILQKNKQRIQQRKITIKNLRC